MRVLVLIAVLTLAACARPDPGLRAGIDPFTAEPGALRFAFDMPANVRVRPESAALTLAARRSDTDERSAARYGLVRTVSGQWEVFRLAADDRARLAAQQRRIAVWEGAAPERTEGALAITVTACAIGPVPDEARVSVAATGRPGAPLTLLLDEAPLSELLGGAAIGPCDAPG